MVSNMGALHGTTFRRAVAIFVRKRRAPTDLSNPALDSDHLEDVVMWKEDYWVQIHLSIRCEKPSEDDAQDFNAVVRDIARCTPHWLRRRDNPRYDWIWVQEYGDKESLSPSGVAFGGRLPVRLKMILTIEDRGRKDPDNPDRYARYTRAFVNVYKPTFADSRADDMHGMTVIKLMKPMPDFRPRELGGQRVCPLIVVYHSVHVVRINENDMSPSAEMYVHKTADWVTYNMLFNAEWEQR